MPESGLTNWHSPTLKVHNTYTNRILWGPDLTVNYRTVFFKTLSSVSVFPPRKSVVLSPQRSPGTVHRTFLPLLQSSFADPCARPAFGEAGWISALSEVSFQSLIWMLTWMALSLLRTLDSIATPCSVKAIDKYLECFPFPSKVTNCDLRGKWQGLGKRGRERAQD